MNRFIKEAGKIAKQKRVVCRCCLSLIQDNINGIAKALQAEHERTKQELVKEILEIIKGSYPHLRVEKFLKSKLNPKP